MATVVPCEEGSLSAPVELRRRTARQLRVYPELEAHHLPQGNMAAGSDEDSDDGSLEDEADAHAQNKVAGKPSDSSSSPPGPWIISENHSASASSQHDALQELALTLLEMERTMIDILVTTMSEDDDEPQCCWIVTDSDIWHNMLQFQNDHDEIVMGIKIVHRRYLENRQLDLFWMKTAKYLREEIVAGSWTQEEYTTNQIVKVIEELPSLVWNAAQNMEITPAQVDCIKYKINALDEIAEKAAEWGNGVERMPWTKISEYSRKQRLAAAAEQRSGSRQKKSPALPRPAALPAKERFMTEDLLNHSPIAHRKTSDSPTDHFRSSRLEQRCISVIWLTFFSTVVLSLPTFALGMTYSSQMAGTTSDADFWFLLQRSIMQLLGTLSMTVAMVGNTGLVQLTKWSVAIGATFSAICAIIAPILYCTAPTAWSAFVNILGGSIQAFVTLQLALVVIQKLSNDKKNH